MPFYMRVDAQRAFEEVMATIQQASDQVAADAEDTEDAEDDAEEYWAATAEDVEDVEDVEIF
jgi:hypothetical protein